MSRAFKALLPLLLLTLIAPGLAAAGDEAPSYGPQLEGFAYPFPLQQFTFESQGKSLQMGYMDVAPTGPSNGRTAVFPARQELLRRHLGGFDPCPFATRFALLYPDRVDRLVLVNPIGLEDWKALGVPYRTVDHWNARELKTTADGIRAYEKATPCLRRACRAGPGCSWRVAGNCTDRPPASMSADGSRSTNAGSTCSQA